MKKAFAHKHNQLYLPLAVLLLVSLACQLPAVQMPFVLDQPTTQPDVTPSVSAEIKTLPTAVANQPPVLVEAQPPAGSDIPAQRGVVFYFSQPMERETLTRSIETEPALQSGLEWLDDATVRMNLPADLPSGDEIKITFNTNTRSQAGVHMLEPVELRYRVPEAVQVVDRLPAPGSESVNPGAAVVATFNRPVVALLGEETAAQPAGFTLTPEAQGRGEWINTSTFIFYPEPALVGGENYRVTVNPELGIAAEPDWTFTTSRPNITSIEAGDGEWGMLDTPVVVRFNQPMDPEATQAAFRLVTDDGQAAEGQLSWNEDRTELTFQPTGLLARDTRYTVEVSTQARSAAGSPLISQEGTVSFLTVPDFRLVSTDLVDGMPVEILESGYLQVKLQFTSPPDLEDVEDRVAVAPELSQKQVYRGQSETELIVGGYFKPNTAYTISLPPEMKDRWGQTLGQVYEIPFETSPALPDLTIPMLQVGTNILYLSTGEESIPARVTNLPSLSLTNSPIPLEDFLQLVYEDRTAYNPRQPRTWQQTLNVAADSSQPVELPLMEGSQRLAPGLYYYRAASPLLDARNTVADQPILLVVSDVHLSLKRSVSELFIWAVSTREMTAAGGKTLTVYGEHGQVLGTATTDDQGVARVELPAGLDPSETLFAVSGKQGEPGFTLATTAWSYGLNGWNYGLPTSPTDDRPMVYLYSDRPVYQPGQQVNFRAVARQARNGRYSLLSNQQLTFKVFGQSDTGEPPVIYEQALPLSTYGTAHGSFTLPDDALPGYYTMRVDEIEDAWLSIQVANYRKPEIELEVSLAAGDLLAGQPLSVTARAAYYFGASADGLPLAWAVYARPEYFYLPGYQTGKQDDRWLLPASFWEDYSALGRQIASGQATTGANGEVAIDIPADALSDLDTEIPYRLTVEATLQDEARQPVSARGQTMLHPADFYVGIQPDAWTGQAGAEIGFDVQVVDWNQQPAGEHALAAEFRKVSWKRVEADPASRLPASYTPEYTPVSSADFRTDASGRARLVFTPPDAGTYQLDIRGDGAVSQALLWVGGPGMAPWPDLPDQQIRLTPDADSYRPGDTARIFIPNPLGEGTQALITVERARVMRHFVLPIDAASHTFELPLSDDDAPNVYLSVQLLGRGTEGQLVYRQGYLNLTVEPVAQALQVELLAQPQQAGPGEEVDLALRVSDARGQPVQGEFSLALIDKALLALTEPNSIEIMPAFYGQQPLAVASSLSAAASARLAPVMAGGRGGGGGISPPPDLREDFKDTAYWNGSLETGPDGQARVSVTLPDNLTTWVVDARGLTADTRVGSASGEVVTTKQLLVRPVTPRFLVVGDHVELAAVVHNNTDQALNSEVTLQATGVALDDPNQALQKVDVPAGVQTRVSWWVTAQDEAEAELVFSVHAGELQDAARPAQGSLPIRRYSARQTFATAGMLAEEGQRQEWIGLPRSFTPTGGELRVELSPSLAATVVSGLQALDAFPYDEFPEAVLSRMLPNLEAYNALKGLGVDSADLQTELESKVQDGLSRLARAQNEDGGWGWNEGSPSDSYLSAYILFGLSRAQASGFQTPGEMISRAQQYVAASTASDPAADEPWQMERAVFQNFMLQQSGSPVNVDGMLAWSDRLTPWSKALLALMLETQTPGDERARTLLAEVQEAAVRTATGARWEAPADAIRNLASADFVTAVVVYTLAKLDPASALLLDGARYLAASRSANGGWASSYETAWAILALTEALKGTGDLQASFDFTAHLNGAPLAAGQAGTGALTPVVSSVGLEDLPVESASPLEISRGSGPGRLYYRAFLEIHRPAESAPAVEHGLAVARSYTMVGQNCRVETCEPLTSVKLGDQPVTLLARVTLTLPHEVSHLVVEDFTPAGAEIVDVSLETSQQGQPEVVDAPQYDARDPFAEGWGWWLFRGPRIYADHIRWTAEALPAGTYQLTYRLVVQQAGEFQVLPARGYEYYFPEIEGSSAGMILTVQP